MVMALPPASKCEKIRTGNYYLSWSGLNAWVTPSACVGMLMY